MLVIKELFKFLKRSVPLLGQGMQAQDIPMDRHNASEGYSLLAFTGP
jgi:hypothetical protein